MKFKTLPLFMTSPENYQMLLEGQEIAIGADFDYVVASFELEGYLTPDDRPVLVGIYGDNAVYCQATGLDEVSEVTIRVRVKAIEKSEYEDLSIIDEAFDFEEEG